MLASGLNLRDECIYDSGNHRCTGLELVQRKLGFRAQKATVLWHFSNVALFDFSLSVLIGVSLVKDAPDEQQFISYQPGKNIHLPVLQEETPGFIRVLKTARLLQSFRSPRTDCFECSDKVVVRVSQRPGRIRRGANLLPDDLEIRVVDRRVRSRTTNATRNNAIDLESRTT